MLPVPDRQAPSDARRWAGDPWQVRVLDPATAPQVRDQPAPLATAYVGPRRNSLVLH